MSVLEVLETRFNNIHETIDKYNVELDRLNNEKDELSEKMKELSKKIEALKKRISKVENKKKQMMDVESELTKTYDHIKTSAENLLSVIDSNDTLKEDSDSDENSEHQQHEDGDMSTLEINLSTNNAELTNDEIEFNQFTNTVNMMDLGQDTFIISQNNTTFFN